MLTRCKACLEKVKNKNLCKNMRQLCNLLHTQALVAGALQSSYGMGDNFFTRVANDVLQIHGLPLNEAADEAASHLCHWIVPKCLSLHVSGRCHFSLLVLRSAILDNAPSSSCEAAFRRDTLPEAQVHCSIACTVCNGGKIV